MSQLCLNDSVFVWMPKLELDYAVTKLTLLISL